ncbi:hypothetical protein LCGC14_2648370, partial [marine sediment metagenome]
KYQKYLEANNALDFDDLLSKVVHLFKNFPEVLEKYQDKFRYILIDEYQDTNSIQEKIFFQLAGGSRNIYVVGDDDQSLYRFRGAAVENLVRFEERCNMFLGKKPKRIDLSINYGSSGMI